MLNDTPEGDTPVPRGPAQRKHDALAALCRNALASRTLSSNRGLPATVVLSMDIDQLEAAAGVATTATGGTIPIRGALAPSTASPSAWAPTAESNGLHPDTWTADRSTGSTPSTTHPTATPTRHEQRPHSPEKLIFPDQPPATRLET